MFTLGSTRSDLCKDIPHLLAPRGLSRLPCGAVGMRKGVRVGGGRSGERGGRAPGERGRGAKGAGGRPGAAGAARGKGGRGAGGAYHHGALREALVAAALEIIEAGDVGSVSLREVARRAGVTSAAPYHHFKDKNALLAA